MSKVYFVSIRGVSHDNEDGSSRQEIISKLQRGEILDLIADPMNKYDRWAVGVYTKKGVQIGFLPSDARDSSSILKGEPISAKVAKIVGGTNWFNKYILGKKSLGIIVELEKSEPDWNRYNKLCEKAKPLDDLVDNAVKSEKNVEVNVAIENYEEVIRSIYLFTKSDEFASAHRSRVSPVNRLSLLLERQKNYSSALKVINSFLETFDPVQPTKTEMNMIVKRKERLESKLSK